MDQFLSFNIGQIAQVVIVLIGIGMMFQTVKGDIRNQSERLAKIEDEVSELRKVFIANARTDERLNYIDQRIMIQGRRLDTLTDSLIRKPDYGTFERE